MLLLFTEDGNDDDKGFALTLVYMQLDLLPCDRRMHNTHKQWPHDD